MSEAKEGMTHYLQISGVLTLRTEAWVSWIYDSESVCILQCQALRPRQPPNMSDHSSPAPTLQTLIQAPSAGATVQVPLPSPRVGVLFGSGSQGFPFLRFEFNHVFQIVLFRAFPPALLCLR